MGGGGVKMCDKMAISTYIMKIAENDPFLRLQMRAIEMFDRFIITNFKTDRYLNNFQEHFGILRLRKYQTSLQNFFLTWERG